MTYTAYEVSPGIKKMLRDKGLSESQIGSASTKAMLKLIDDDCGCVVAEMREMVETCREKLDRALERHVESVKLSDLRAETAAALFKTILLIGEKYANGCDKSQLVRSAGYVVYAFLTDGEASFEP